MKTIILFIIAGLLGTLGWLCRIVAFLVKGQSFVLKYMDWLLGKGMRPLRCLLNKEIRMRRNKRQNKKPPIIPVQKEAQGSIVGGTKTVFIYELPGQKEPEPLETIELPLEEPEPPEIMDNDHSYETDVMSEEEMRREMEEALYGDSHEDQLPDDYLGGVTIGQIENAYNAIHDEDAAGKENDDTIGSVLYSLNGTDMFKFIIDTRESDIKAKAIMDRYAEKHSSASVSGGKKEFRINDFVE